MLSVVQSPTAVCSPGPGAPCLGHTAEEVAAQLTEQAEEAGRESLPLLPLLPAGRGPLADVHRTRRFSNLFTL